MKFRSSILTWFALLSISCGDGNDGQRSTDSQGAGTDRPGRDSRDARNAELSSNEHDARADRAARRNLEELSARGLPASLLAGTTASDEEWRDAIRFIREADLDACIEAMRLMAVTPQYETLLLHLATRLAKEDPERAAKWLLGLPEDSSNRSAFAVIGSALARDPEIAMSTARRISDTDLQERFLTAYLRDRGQMDPAGMMAEFARARDEFSVDLGKAMDWVASGLSEENVDVLLPQLLEVYREVEARSRSLAASELARGAFRAMDDSSRVQFAESLAADSESEALLYSNFVGEWAKRSPIEASGWLVDQDGPHFVHGARALATSIAMSDPVSAVRWALEIGDASLKEQALRDVVSRVQAERPGVARELLASDLPQDLRDELVGRVTRN